MDKKARQIAESLAEAINRNYRLVTQGTAILDLAEVARTMTSRLRINGFNGVFDQSLIPYLQEEGIFFQPYRRVISQRQLISAYIGQILDEPKTGHPYFLATRQGEIRGSDFYDSHIGVAPTVLRVLSERVLIDKDNVEVAYKRLYPGKEIGRFVNDYVDQVIASGSIGADKETRRLVDSLQGL